MLDRFTRLHGVCEGTMVIFSSGWIGRFCVERKTEADKGWFESMITKSYSELRRQNQSSKRPYFSLEC